MRDKFWNFVFYKFIFVFGVLNVQEMPEMMCWCVVVGLIFPTHNLGRPNFDSYYTL